MSSPRGQPEDDYPSPSFIPDSYVSSPATIVPPKRPLDPSEIIPSPSAQHTQTPSSYFPSPSDITVKPPSPAFVSAPHSRRPLSDDYEEAQSETLHDIELSRSEDYHHSSIPLPVLQPPEPVYILDPWVQPPKRSDEFSPPRRLPKEARFANTVTVQDDNVDLHKREETVWNEEDQSKEGGIVYGKPTRPDYARSMSTGSVASEEETENFDDDVLYDWSAEEDLEE